MYEQYAPDPVMRKNLGIRRRLAPLLDNDRARIQLLYALLLSLPGSPIIYYGDEMGMGDRFELEDRDGVRTPMQWDDSPTAGFSTADPEALYLPLVDAAGYRPADLNVAAARSDTGSLLNWTRHLLEVRRAHAAFGAGRYAAVAASDEAVMAFVRDDGSERLLVVANFADRHVDTALAVDGEWRTLTGNGVELAGGSVSAEPHGWGWFEPA
jgi:maltose alpha-D-glucosyltransferase/alpha-amylase